MDTDDFDDDLADEDLARALTQSGTVGETSSASRTSTGNTTRSADSGPLGDDDDDLDGLLIDAFTSAPGPRRAVGPSTTSARPRQSGLTRTASNSFRQTNLFGDTIVDEAGPELPQPGFGRVYRGDKPEAPSQHALNNEALKAWVYPKNLGAVRDYQYSIVKNGLFNNTLVALPTGLGKTFIAATVMLNFYRWTKDAKIVFVAPTKPLVAQQVDACFNIVGISRSETTVLTGESAPGLRAEEWQSRRVFFMTPQTLLNDISRGYADPKSIVLLVVDEAHRATGEYAYAKVAKLMRRFNPSFRVLALTATPGSKIETVQEVMDNLGISHTEIRTEDSMDIRQYVHKRHLDMHLLDPSDEMCEVKTLFTKALKPLMDKLTQQNIYYGRDPMAISTFGLMKQEKEWMASVGRNKPYGLQNMMRAVFAILKSLAHSIKLLNFHGIKPFYENLKEFRGEVEAQGDKGSKYKKQLVADSSFQEMMARIESWLRIPTFVGHPKLEELANTILNHFMDANARGASASRAIVFSEYRDSAEEIVRALNIHKPLIKASVFVGQAESKRSAGMKQAEQIKTVENFKKGDFNVLVATSIGEEGLDIGQVDLIVCYDASSSPIRMLQRMGRTGRKREGNVVLLLMKGKEEQNFAQAKDNYEEMQKLICEGSKFNFRHDLSTRIVPRDVRPEVDMQLIDIPIENTQNTSLPEPGRRKEASRNRKNKTKKLPPKKFHMPDGVETGFVKASNLGRAGAGSKKDRPTELHKAADPTELAELADIPPLTSVFLTPEQTRELDRDYRSLPRSKSKVEVTTLPSVTSYPQLQRRERPIGKVKHGRRTKNFVKMMRAMATTDRRPRFSTKEDTSSWKGIPLDAFTSDTEDEGSTRRGEKRHIVATVSDSEDVEVAAPRPKKRQSNASARRRSPHSALQAAAGVPFVESGEEEEEQVPAPNRGRPKKAVTKKPRRGKPTSRRGRGINSDEVGDDCERDSDALLDTDGSDSGADLLDFVVGDDQPISSMRASSTLPTSASPSPISARTKHTGVTATSDRTNSFDAPVELLGTQESIDDDLPSLDDLLSARAKLGPLASKRADVELLGIVEHSGEEEFEEMDDIALPRKLGAAARQQRRRVIVEESEESDEEY